MGGKNLFSKTVDGWHLGSSAERSVEMSAILSSGSRADVVTSMCSMVKRSKWRQPFQSIISNRKVSRNIIS